MRLLLIVLQVTVAALIYIGASLATGTFAGGLGSGGGPVARAAVIFLVMQAFLLGMLFFTVVLPFLFVLLGTLCCAVLAGYRFFRWTRWIGIAINIAAACYCLFAAGGNEVKPVAIELRIGFIFFFLCNGILFFMIPKQPDIRKSRQITARAHLILPFCIVLPVLFMLTQLLSSDSMAVMEIIKIIVFFLVYSIPFVLNSRAARTVSLPGDVKKIILPLIVSLAVTGLGNLAAPILAIPVGISLLIFILFLEMLFLYPEHYPQQAWHVYCVRLLGRLPDKPVPLS